VRWFKHLVESGSDPDIGAMMDEFGFKGYYLFFRTLEILGRECDSDNPGVLNGRFSWFLNQYRRGITSKLLQNYFRFCSELDNGNGRFIFIKKGKRFSLNCPKFKKIVDEYTRQKPYRNTEKVTEEVTSEVTKKVTPKNIEYKNIDKRECSEKDSPNPLKEKKSSFKYEKRHMDEAKYLELAVKSTNPRYKLSGNNYLGDWANTFRIMEEKKEATMEEIHFLIKYAHDDGFWYRNILSASKLRKQFSRLWEDARQEWEKNKEKYVGKNK